MCSLLVFVVVTAVALAPVRCIDKVIDMRVHYQFTADSSRFIRQQLFPTYLYLNGDKVSRLEVDLVPYQDENCESDPSEYIIWECLNDKLHACATSVLPPGWPRLNFVHCITDGEKSGYLRSPACAAQTCTDDAPLAFCVNSVDGDELLEGNVNTTRALGVAMTSYPIVTFDGVYNADEQAAARENLLALLCAKYGAALNGLCDNARATKTMEHHNYGTYFFYSLQSRCDL